MAGRGRGGGETESALAVVREVATKLSTNYQQTTPRRLRVLDVFLAFVFATGVQQFLYCMLIGSFPFNSFLAGFMCTVGVFVLAVSLRMQVMEGSSKEGGMVGGRSFERCFAEYVVCNMVLFLVVMNFMG